MKKFISILFLLFTFHFGFSQGKPDAPKSDTNELTGDQTMTMYVVVAGTSVNYPALESLAKQIAKKTGLNFENDLVYDQKRGMIVPDTSSDEIYAGSYFPRRYPEERISVEMLWYYKDQQNENTLKDMIIITGIFEKKEDATKQLEKVKAVVPTAYTKQKQMYMGCMH